MIKASQPVEALGTRRADVIQKNATQPVEAASAETVSVSETYAEERLWKKFEKLNLTLSEGYPSRNAKPGGLLTDQFVKRAIPSRWYEMYADKENSDRSTVGSWSLQLAKLNSVFSRQSLPSAPASHTISQVIKTLGAFF